MGARARSALRRVFINSTHLIDARVFLARGRGPHLGVVLWSTSRKAGLPAAVYLYWARAMADLSAKCASLVQSMLAPDLPRTRTALLSIIRVLQYAHCGDVCSASVLEEIRTKTFDAFPPTNVDLWCMELTEDARPVANEDVFMRPRTKTCAMEVYSGFLVSPDGGLWEALATAAAPEVLFRTMPWKSLIRCHLTPANNRALQTQWTAACECDIVQVGGVLGANTMRLVLDRVRSASLDESALFKSAAMEACADHMGIAAQALVYINDASDPRAKRWTQRLCDREWDDENMERLYLALARVMEKCFHSFYTDYDVATAVPFLCGILSTGKHHARAQSLVQCALNAHISLHVNLPSNRTPYSKYVTGLQSAIAACTPAPRAKSAAV